MKVLAIIQARLGSQRLPGKVLMDICGKPMIQHVVERVRAIDGLADVVLACPMSDRQAFTSANLGVLVIAPEVADSDVLSRYWGVAQMYQPDYVMRITGDCCFLDPKVSSAVIKKCIRGGFDYVHNTGASSKWPEGIDTEVFRARVLDEAHCQAVSAEDREHVTRFIRLRPDRFKHGLLTQREADWSRYHLSVDTNEDLARAKAVFTLMPEGRRDVNSVIVTVKAIERFQGQVDRSESGCWLWTGSVFSDGYGRAQIWNRGDRAHRVAYKIANGQIPNGQLVCHTCDTPKCCRPSHLFLGTPQDNTQDAIRKGRVKTVGQDNRNSKLTEAQVISIRKKFAAGARKWALSQEFGVNAEMVMHIVRGKHWADTPGPLFKSVNGASSKPKYVQIRD